MTKSKRRPTVRDVAREAGVSHQTVSRVINNNENVSDATRLRVLKAIEALDFHPNRAAQILQTKRSQTLEVVVPYYGFNNRVLYDMARAAHDRGYHFVISAIDHDELADTLENANARFVDGLILVPLMAVVDDYATLNRLAHGVPFVQIGARLGVDLPSVVCDQGKGARLATQHLIDLGHRQIAEISGPLLSYDGYDRHESWLTTMADNDLEPRLSVEGDFTIEGGYREMSRILNSGEPFTAVFIGNDSMALGAQTALREHGLRVPDDISIVGFDDVPEASHYVPGLTTVQQNFQLLAQLAIDYIVELIEKPDTPIYQRVLPPSLIIRKSTRAIR